MEEMRSKAMAKYIKAVSIAFNENDGGLSWVIDPECAYDIHRHYRIYGKWKARWMFLRMFWIGLRQLEKYE